MPEPSFPCLTTSLQKAGAESGGKHRYLSPPMSQLGTPHLHMNCSYPLTPRASNTFGAHKGLESHSMPWRATGQRQRSMCGCHTTRRDTRTSDPSSLKRRRSEASGAWWTASVWGQRHFLFENFLYFLIFLKPTFTIRFGGCFSKAINNCF